MVGIKEKIAEIDCREPLKYEYSSKSRHREWFIPVSRQKKSSKEKKYGNFLAFDIVTKKITSLYQNKEN
jgi:hypothetical protein